MTIESSFTSNVDPAEHKKQVTLFARAISETISSIGYEALDLLALSIALIDAQAAVLASSPDDERRNLMAEAMGSELGARLERYLAAKTKGRKRPPSYPEH